MEDMYEEVEQAIAFLQSKVRADIEQNLIEEANRNKPNYDRLRSLGMID
jgi:hypothetical protein